MNRPEHIKDPVQRALREKYWPDLIEHFKLLVAAKTKRLSVDEDQRVVGLAIHYAFEQLFWSDDWIRGSHEDYLRLWHRKWYFTHWFFELHPDLIPEPAECLSIQDWKRLVESGEKPLFPEE